MTRVAVGYNEATQVPYLGLVSDGSTFQIVNVAGEVPGSEGVLREMQGLFVGDALDLFRTFELYAASFGMTTSPPVEVVGGVADNAVKVATELGLAQGVGSPARQWLLQRVANARSNLALDSLLVADAAQYDPELGLDSAWLPEARAAFLEAAGWEPYALSAPEEELAVALQARIASWDAEPHVSLPIVLPEGEVVPVEPAATPLPSGVPPEAAPAPAPVDQVVEVEGQ